MTQDEFDRWLEARPVEKADENLASRISQAALQTPQQKGRAKWHLPPSAFIAASFLVVFVVLTTVLPLGKSNDSTEIESISDAQLMGELFYYADDTLLF